MEFYEIDGLDGDENYNKDLDNPFLDNDSEDDIALGSGGDWADAFIDAEDSNSDNYSGVIEATVVKVPLQSKGGVNHNNGGDYDKEEESETKASFANMEESEKEEDAANNNTNKVEQQSDKKSAKKPKFSDAFEDAKEYQKSIAKARADRDTVFGTASTAAEPKKDAKKEKRANSNKASSNINSLDTLAREISGKKKLWKRKIKS